MGEVSTRLYIGNNPVAETVFNGEFVAINPYTIPIDFIVAGGGGGGGASPAGQGGAGGAGGVVTGSFVSFLHSLTIVVGAGGTASGDTSNCANFCAGLNGSNSYIIQPSIAYFGLGGGGGGGNTTGGQNGKAGGSGGGGVMIDSTAYTKGVATQPSSSYGGYGHDGANGSGIYRGYGGAGGGAGSPAIGGDPASGADPGSPIIWFDSVSYSKGGKAWSSDSCAFQVPANSGNGGGAATNPGNIYIPGSIQCNGASGIVKLRYPGSTPLATGGTITTTGGYTYHTFTSSGTLTWQFK
jgi:hypothetical protein